MKRVGTGNFSSANCRSATTGQAQARAEAQLGFVACRTLSTTSVIAATAGTVGQRTQLAAWRVSPRNASIRAAARCRSAALPGRDPFRPSEFNEDINVCGSHLRPT